MANLLTAARGEFRHATGRDSWPVSVCSVFDPVFDRGAGRVNATTLEKSPTYAEPSSNLGMWIFIATEVLFFGALVTAFSLYRSAYAASFAAGSHALNFVA